MCDEACERIRDEASTPSQEITNGHRLTVWRAIARLPALCVIGLVKGYQWLLSPLFGGQCRFYPSCSNYFIEAVRKHGVISGSLRGIARILRCHPFHRGGYDPP
ncbi:MAG: membrane protein insertion efficiency factor YidD [Planctomycetaceae bacterium]